MAKAVAIIPVGHDFPPFSANKGGSIEGSKLFLLTFDLAFQIQEQLRALEAGGDVSGRRRPRRRVAAPIHALLKRLLRQWAIPPARQFNRLPSRARVVMCTGLAGVWQYSRGAATVGRRRRAGLPPMHAVPGHQPHARRLRVTPDRSGSRPAAHRRTDRVARRGPRGPQVAMVRWFRNTLKGSALEFGCEILSDSPEAAAAAAEKRRKAKSGAGRRPARHPGQGGSERCRRSSLRPARSASIRA